jgi:hypothetical protein
MATVVSPSTATAMGSPRKVMPPMDLKATSTSTIGNPGRGLSYPSERTSSTAAAVMSRSSPLELTSGTFNRRLTATLSPEECKLMFTHTEKVTETLMLTLLPGARPSVRLFL